MLKECCGFFSCQGRQQEELENEDYGDSAIEQTASGCHQLRNTIFSNSLIGGVIGFSAICISVLPYAINGTLGYASSLGAPPPQLAIAVIGFIAVGIILGAIYGLTKGICDLCVKWKEIK